MVLMADLKTEKSLSGGLPEPRSSRPPSHASCVGSSCGLFTYDGINLSLATCVRPAARRHRFSEFCRLSFLRLRLCSLFTLCPLCGVALLSRYTHTFLGFIPLLPRGLQPLLR
eukprot:Hpha_TRINITY_DN16445_c0_g1::TRINITY_DN16445_c0_g1_i1::g.159015::m.159015